ncbi:MAG: hypothetical protein ACE5JB_13280 [bacterium]
MDLINEIEVIKRKARPISDELFYFGGGGTPHLGYAEIGLHIFK